MMTKVLIYKEALKAKLISWFHIIVGVWNYIAPLVNLTGVFYGLGTGNLPLMFFAFIYLFASMSKWGRIWG
jgi:hypothetical protein